MVGDPYEASDDPACYPGTQVLINLADIRDQEELDEYEIRRVGLRSFDLPAFQAFSPAEYRALHRHLFQDVYPWAGEYRTNHGKPQREVAPFVALQVFGSLGDALFDGLSHADDMIVSSPVSLREPHSLSDGDDDHGRFHDAASGDRSRRALLCRGGPGSA